MILLLLALVLNSTPHECAIDFSLVRPVPFEYELTLEFGARDGTSLDVTVVVFKNDDDPDLTSCAFRWALKDNGWVGREAPNATLVVTGTKKGSPITSVKVKSDRVLPIQIHWVPLTPKFPVAPMPREVNPRDAQPKP